MIEVIYEEIPAILKLFDPPKTGDNNNVGLWMLVGLSSLIFAVTVKRKKES